MDKKFRDKYINGEAAFEEIDDYCYRWGVSELTCTLREYMGFSAEEEDAWVEEGEEALRGLLDTAARR